MSAQPVEGAQTWSFEAVWPIVAPEYGTTALYEEAIVELPALAAKHGAELVGEPDVHIRRGDRTPGSQGAQWCITASCPARPARRKAEHWPQLRAVPDQKED